ncbi:MAG: T9SS type A sorting domain-containing protein [Fidelibacterota bacterium]
MKKVLIMMMSLLLAAGAFATTIRDIQYTTDTSGDSPLKDQTVTVSGIVSGEPYAFGGNIMFIQDDTLAWSGIMVDLGVHVDQLVAEGVIVAEGDSVTVSGTVVETDGMTRIASVTSLVHEKAGVGCYAPLVVASGSLSDEQYEGCLVRVRDVDISNGNTGAGEWEVNDGSGVITIDDDGNAPYYFWPEEYDDCISVTGLLHEDGGTFKIMPRLAWDIVEGYKTGQAKIYTRIQRIQQVRYSDLLKTPQDYESDKSYFDGIDTTLNVKGIVTMPTGISYAGDGVKFILADEHSGPWSAILSYNADASVYPDLYAGDVIEMSGYVDEFTRGNSNMTEFLLVGDIEIIEEIPIEEMPDTALVKTADMRHPVTAEQWGNSFVKIEDAFIIDNDIQYYIFEVDDGSGSCLIGYDSDSLAARAGNDFMRAPTGTVLESVTGWVYHHYGSYEDSTTYNINPLYKEDIVVGEGPVMLLEAERRPANIPESTHDVTVSIHAFTTRGIDTAKVYYKVEDGELTGIDMIDIGDDIWSAVIPAQEDNAIVEYYYYFVDDSSEVSAHPAKYNEKLLSYKVLDSDPTIYDIQYTHAQSGLSPLHGCNVEFNASVTMDGSLGTSFTDNEGRGVVPVASASGPWNAVWVLTDTMTLKNLHEGDYVTVTGVVDDDHEKYYKFQNNTYVVGTVNTVLQGELPPAPTTVTLADLENDFEAYEGLTVEVTDGAEIASVNDYDLTMDDGANTFLLDDDFVPDSVMRVNYLENVVFNGIDTLVAGDSINSVTGIVIYSYSEGKIVLRKASDISYTKVETETGVRSTPGDFILAQNYPNPFNPVTTINFELPKATNVTLQVFDITGRLVTELANGPMNAGRYDLRWNAGHLSSGVYFYRLQTPEFTATNKMLLLK